MTTITLTSTTASGFLETDFDQLSLLIDGEDTGAITANTAKISYSTAASDAVALNTAKPSSIVSGVSGADAITNIISLTTAEYGAIGSPDSATLYIITDA